MSAFQMSLYPNLSLAVEWKVISLAEAWGLQDQMLLSNEPVVVMPPPLHRAASLVNLLAMRPEHNLVH